MVWFGGWQESDRDAQESDLQDPEILEVLRENNRDRFEVRDRRALPEGEAGDLYIDGQCAYEEALIADIEDAAIVYAKEKRGWLFGLLRLP